MKVAHVAALVLMLSPGAAPAASEVVCSAVEDVLWAIDEIETEDPDSSRVSKIALTRLSIGSMQALGYSQSFADEGALPAEITQALETIRDSLRADVNGPEMPFEEARPGILKSGIVIIAAMPDPCPHAELPDLSVHAE